MSTDPDKQADPEDGDGVFDAVAAAEELAASLGLEGGKGDSAQAQAQAQAYEATLEGEIEELNGLLDEKDGKIAKLEALLAKAATARDAAHDEIERASARIVKEELKKREQKHRKMLLQFLEILDDFDRAFAAIEKKGHPDSVLDGVEIVRNSFLRKLNELGVTHYISLATPFDANLHDAVTLVPVTDPNEDGQVVAVVAEGYRIGDECLRPARVAVGKL